MPTELTSLPRFARHVQYVFQRYHVHGCTQTAAALTFTTLLALVPALVLILGVLGTFSYFARYAQDFRTFAFANLVPEAAGRLTAIYVEQFVEHAGSLTAVGTVLLALSVLALLLMFDRALNGIWQVPHPRPLWQRIVRSSLFVLAGPLLIGVSLSFGTRLVSLVLGEVMFLSLGQKFLLHAVPVVLNAIVLALFYRLAPKAYMPWRQVVVVSLVIAAALDGMKLGFGWYVRTVMSYRLIYGTFAGLPIFLLWLYIGWAVVLFGAVMTACWSHRNLPAAQALPTPWERLQLAQQVLDFLGPLREDVPGHRRRLATVTALHDAIGAPYDELANVLDELGALGYVHVTRRGSVAASRVLLPDGDALWTRFLGAPKEVRSQAG